MAEERPEERDCTCRRLNLHGSLPLIWRSRSPGRSVKCLWEPFNTAPYGALIQLHANLSETELFFPWKCWLLYFWQRLALRAVQSSGQCISLACLCNIVLINDSLKKWNWLQFSTTTGFQLEKAAKLINTISQVSTFGLALPVTRPRQAEHLPAKTSLCFGKKNDIRTARGFKTWLASNDE